MSEFLLQQQGMAYGEIADFIDRISTAMRDYCDTKHDDGGCENCRFATHNEYDKLICSITDGRGQPQDWE